MYNFGSNKVLMRSVHTACGGGAFLLCVGSYTDTTKGVNPFLIATYFLMQVSGIPSMQISGKEFTPVRELSAFLFPHLGKFSRLRTKGNKSVKLSLCQFLSSSGHGIAFWFAPAKVHFFYKLCK